MALVITWVPEAGQILLAQIPLGPFSVTWCVYILPIDFLEDPCRAPREWYPCLVVRVPFLPLPHRFSVAFRLTFWDQAIR